MANRKITPQQLKKLESLPGFELYNLDEGWKANYESLKAFVGKNTKLPSASNGDSEERKLGRWVLSQRSNKKQGTTILSPDLIAKLESIKGWTWISSPKTDKEREASWEGTLQELKSFIKKNGRYPSSLSQDKAEKRLGKWVSEQKRQVWRDEAASRKPKPLKFDSFEVMFDKVCDFIREHGEYPSPFFLAYDEKEEKEKDLAGGYGEEYRLAKWLEKVFDDDSHCQDRVMSLCDFPLYRKEMINVVKELREENKEGGQE